MNQVKIACLSFWIGRVGHDPLVFVLQSCDYNRYDWPIAHSPPFESPAEVISFSPPLRQFHPVIFVVLPCFSRIPLSSCVLAPTNTLWPFSQLLSCPAIWSSDLLPFPIDAPSLFVLDHQIPDIVN